MEEAGGIFLRNVGFDFKKEVYNPKGESLKT
jgi:hypothetical protein